MNFGADDGQKLRDSRQEKRLTMAMQTFVDLPVKDLTKATEFFNAIGFSFDPEFTDENAPAW